MSRKSALIKLARAPQIMEIVTLCQQGYTIKDACAEVGISERMYYYYMSKHPNSIEVISQFTTEVEKQDLAKIVEARRHALDKLIEAIPEAPTFEVLQIDAHLRAEQQILEGKYGVRSTSDNTAKEFVLSGPKLQTAQSKLGPGQTQTTINVSPNNNGSVDITVTKSPDIIDGEFSNTD